MSPRRWNAGVSLLRVKAEWRALRVVESILCALVALLAFALASASAPITDFNPDESRWLSRAHYLADLADPFGPTWDDQYMTRGQPPLGSYAIGLGLLLQGRDLATNPPWDFSVTWETNIAIGNKPAPPDLAAGRRTSALFVALTTLALIGVGRIFLPLPWALVAGALYAIHPFTTYVGSLAMSDALFGMLIALSALAAARLARHPSWACAALVGTLLGLGGATKLSPLGVAAGLCGAGLLLLASTAVRHCRLPLETRRAAAYGTAILLSAIAVFIVVYPYLWPNPIERTRQLFVFRAEEMATQAADWPVMAVPTRFEAIRRIGVNFTERFNLSAAIASWLGTSSPLMLRQAEVALAIFGIALMCGKAIRAGPYAPCTLAFVVLGGQVVITILGMRAEFDRYHVPMALLGTVAAAVALERLIQPLLHEAINRLRPRVATSANIRNLASRPGD
jgi:hypothetical protein